MLGHFNEPTDIFGTWIHDMLVGSPTSWLFGHWWYYLMTGAMRGHMHVLNSIVAHYHAAVAHYHAAWAGYDRLHKSDICQLYIEPLSQTISSDIAIDDTHYRRWGSIHVHCKRHTSSLTEAALFRCFCGIPKHVNIVVKNLKYAFSAVIIDHAHVQINTSAEEISPPLGGAVDVKASPCCTESRFVHLECLIHIERQKEQKSTKIIVQTRKKSDLSHRKPRRMVVLPYITGTTEMIQKDNEEGGDRSLCPTPIHTE